MEAITLNAFQLLRRRGRSRFALPACSPRLQVWRSAVIFSLRSGILRRGFFSPPPTRRSTFLPVASSVRSRADAGSMEKVRLFFRGTLVGKMPPN